MDLFSIWISISRRREFPDDHDNCALLAALREDAIKKEICGELKIAIREAVPTHLLNISHVDVGVRGRFGEMKASRPPTAIASGNQVSISDSTCRTVLTPGDFDTDTRSYAVLTLGENKGYNKGGRHSPTCPDPQAA